MLPRRRFGGTYQLRPPIYHVRLEDLCWTWRAGTLRIGLRNRSPFLFDNGFLMGCCNQSPIATLEKKAQAEEVGSGTDPFVALQVPGDPGPIRQELVQLPRFDSTCVWIAVVSTIAYDRAYDAVLR